MLNFQFIKLFFSTMIICLLIDGIWIGLIAKNLYMQQIGFLLRKSNGALSPNWPGALVVYIAITLGILLFVLPKAQGNYYSVLIFGALYGLIIYGVFDFTNYSIIANWPLTITLIDLLWGTFLCATTACIAQCVKNYLAI